MWDVPGRVRRRESYRRPQFSLLSVREAHRTVVLACGRLVLGHGADEPLWASQVAQAPATDVALDLACVSDLDARGLGVLAAFVRRARERGTTVSVIAASSVVQRLVELTGLDRALRGAWSERTGVFGCGARPGALHSDGRSRPTLGALTWPASTRARHRQPIQMR